MPIHRIVACLLLAGCATGTTPANCTTEFAGTICLDLSAAGSLVEHQTVIELEVARTLDDVQPLLNVTELRISLIADPTRIIPEVGMGGFNPSTDEVQISWSLAPLVDARYQGLAAAGLADRLVADHHFRWPCALEALPEVARRDR